MSMGLIQRVSIYTRNDIQPAAFLLAHFASSPPHYHLQQELTTEIRISSSSESMFTSMRPPADGTSHVRFSWIWSLEPWTPSVLAPLVNCSDLITSYLDRRVRREMFSLCILLAMIISFIANPPSLIFPPTIIRT